MNKDLIDILLIGVITVAMFIAGLLIGSASSKKILQDDLVRQGHAEYYLDSNNDKQWRIKP